MDKKPARRRGSCDVVLSGWWQRERDSAGCLIGAAMCAAEWRVGRDAGGRQAQDSSALLCVWGCERTPRLRPRVGWGSPGESEWGDFDRFGRDSSAVFVWNMARFAWGGDPPGSRRSRPVAGWWFWTVWYTVHPAPYYAGRLNHIWLAKLYFFSSPGARGIWLKSLKDSSFPVFL
jgi:hypothetical protein